MKDLDHYKSRFENELPRAIESLGEQGALRDACAYALQGGKRLRPILVFLIADALGHQLDVSAAAFSVECFHSASLIADDLPCMDNDPLRRGRPSLHLAFGEGPALLASYTLIAAGYGGISKNGMQMRRASPFRKEADHRMALCLEAATRCAGLNGATQGQYLDLFPPDANVKTIRDMIYKKTVTLFEIAFLFGWVFGGGDLAALPFLKKSALHFGMAFQIADDLEDAKQDAAHTNGINIASILGKKKAISLLDQEIASLKSLLLTSNLWTPPFQALLSTLRGSAP